MIWLLQVYREQTRNNQTNSILDGGDSILDGGDRFTFVEHLTCPLTRVTQEEGVLEAGWQTPYQRTKLILRTNASSGRRHESPTFTKSKLRVLWFQSCRLRPQKCARSSLWKHYTPGACFMVNLFEVPPNPWCIPASLTYYNCSQVVPPLPPLLLCPAASIHGAHGNRNPHGGVDGDKRRQLFSARVRMEPGASESHASRWS